jgi:protein TorT
MKTVNSFNVYQRYSKLGGIVTQTAVAAVFGVTLFAGANVAGAADWFPASVEVWTKPFDMDSPRRAVNYTPLAKAAQKRKICVSFPHVKDSYWLAVGFGVAQESKRLGIEMELFEAGGYGNLKTQIKQIRDCVANGAKGVVIGAISNVGLNDLIKEIRAKNIPVIDVINGVSSKEISAKSLVNFQEMGSKAGDYLVKRQGKKKTKVAWFPGPKGAAWVAAGEKGFTSAIKNSAVNIVVTKYGDTGALAQTKLINEVLDSNQDVDFLVGTAVTAEAAISVLRKRKLRDKIKVIAYYFTPGVYSGIRRQQILAAPTDSPVIQGRIAIDQVVRILEGKPYMKHVGPKISVVDKAALKNFDTASSMAPKGFRIIYTVK